MPFITKDQFKKIIEKHNNEELIMTVSGPREIGTVEHSSWPDDDEGTVVLNCSNCYQCLIHLNKLLSNSLQVQGNLITIEGEADKEPLTIALYTQEPFNPLTVDSETIGDEPHEDSVTIIGPGVERVAEKILNEIDQQRLKTTTTIGYEGLMSLLKVYQDRSDVCLFIMEEGESDYEYVRHVPTPTNEPDFGFCCHGFKDFWFQHTDLKKIVFQVEGNKVEIPAQETRKTPKMELHFFKEKGNDLSLRHCSQPYAPEEKIEPLDALVLLNSVYST